MGDLVDWGLLYIYMNSIDRLLLLGDALYGDIDVFDNYERVTREECEIILDYLEAYPHKTSWLDTFNLKTMLYFATIEGCKTPNQVRKAKSKVNPSSFMNEAELIEYMFKKFYNARPHA